jgi:beta-1,3-galactosyltransferase 1
MKNNSTKIKTLPDYFIPPTPDLRSFITKAELKIRPKNIQITERSADNCNVVVIVTSSLANSKARKAIRETWGQSVREFGLILYFLVGEKNDLSSQNRTNSTQEYSTQDYSTLNETNDLNLTLEDEALTYGDIIQYAFEDSYFNLTLKSLFMMRFFIEELLHLNVTQMTRFGDNVFLGLKDRNKKFIKQVFLMKTDEDMFVHIENLVILTTKLSKYINKVNARPLSLLVGYLIQHARPFRSKNNKYYLPFKVYRDREFPDYLSGTAYLLSTNSIVNIFAAALTQKCRYIHLEDIYLTGICASELGIRRYNHIGFNIFKVDLNNMCYYKSSFAISSHKLSPNELRQVWNSINHSNYSEIVCKRTLQRSETKNVSKKTKS